MQSAKPTRKGLYILWLAAVLGTVLLWAFSIGKIDRSASSPTVVASAAPASSTAPKAMDVADPAGSAVVPEFDAEKAQYLLTAFSQQGMQHVTDAEPLWSLLSPGNTLVAQLIARDTSPSLALKHVTVSYALDEHTMLAKGAPDALRTGVLTPKDGVFVAESIPVMPYTRAGTYNPYPVVTVTAHDNKGVMLASTRVVLPVSTEMGCRNCHTGEWKTSGRGGVSAGTAGHILQAHDKHNNTSLMQRAQSGKTVDCRACHGASVGEITANAPSAATTAAPQAAVVMAKKQRQMNLSAAIHGFHAGVGLKGEEACASCHPLAEKSAMQRDIHATWQIGCTRCHGSLDGHAVALLRGEKDDPFAQRRIAQISPRLSPAEAAMQPRTPWVNLPDCTGCHDFAKKPAGDATAFHQWTASQEELFSRRMENTGKLRCPSCHGSPHAVYPAANPLGDERDNIQPLQYQKLAMPLGSMNNCGVCHKDAMETSIHHDIVAR